VFTVKLSKHDQYAQELCDKIRDDYDSVSTNILLKKKRRSLAEIDIAARKGNLYDIYEVKCSYRITKAKKQAKAIRKHFHSRIKNIYFYCGATASLILL
jgi:Holliday junction resolvase-like predicted endonuclease